MTPPTEITTIALIHKCVFSQLQPLNVVLWVFVPAYCLHCDHSVSPWCSISLHTEAHKSTPCGDSKTPECCNTRILLQPPTPLDIPCHTPRLTMPLLHSYKCCGTP